MMFELIARPLVDAAVEAAAEMAEAIADEGIPGAAEVFERMATSAAETAEELTDKTRALFEAGAAFAEEEVEPRIEALGEALYQLSMGNLGAAAGGTESILEACSSVMGAVEVLAAPVNWARGIVDTINSLLDAMNLGL